MDTYAYIRKLAKERGVDPDLAVAVMHQESRGKKKAVSPKGAQGLMQTMPDTLADPGFGVTPAKNSSAEEKARVGVDYLKAMLKRYKGDVPSALAAYNAGPGRADKYGANVPFNETKKYIRNITNDLKVRKGTAIKKTKSAPRFDFDALMRFDAEPSLAEKAMDFFVSPAAADSEIPFDEIQGFDDANGVNALEFGDPLQTDGGNIDMFNGLDTFSDLGGVNPAKDLNPVDDPWASLDALESWDETPSQTVEQVSAPQDSDNPTKDSIKAQLNGMGIDFGSTGGGIASGYLNAMGNVAKISDKLFGWANFDEKAQADRTALLNAGTEAFKELRAENREGDGIDWAAMGGSMLTPVPPVARGGTLLSTLGNAALSGATIGGMYGDTSADSMGTDVLKNVALGGTLGAGLPGGMKGAGYAVNKSANAVMNKMNPQAIELQKLADEAGMRMLANDAMANNKVNNTFGAVMDVLPFVGTGGIRRGQQKALEAKARELTDIATKTAQDMPYDKVKGLTTAAKDVTSQAATTKKIMDEAGNDLGKILGASADLMTTKEAMEANRLYGKFRDSMSKAGVKPDYTSTISVLETQIDRLNKTAFRDDQLVSALKIARNKLNQGGNTAPDSMLELRAGIKSLMEKATGGQLFIHKASAVNALNQVKKAIDTDIQTALGGPKSKLSKQLSVADTFERNIVKGREGAKLTKALEVAKTTGDYDEVSNLVLRPHLQDRATRAVELMDSKGRQALLATMMKKGLDMSYANSTGEFNIKTMSTYLSKMAPALKQLGGADYSKQVEGYHRLLKHMNTRNLDRKMTLGSTPIVGGLFGAGLYSSAALFTPSFAASATGAALLFRSEAGKRLLLASSKTPINSPAFNKLIQEADALAQQAAARSATTE